MIIDNMNFYNFMHRQILVLIALFSFTGMGYLYIGWLYSSMFSELLWFLGVLILSLWGYKLHRVYLNKQLNMGQKEKWLRELRYFLFIYFSMWTLMFFVYTARSAIELHYVAIATQLGVTVVSATVLVSQRVLARVTLLTLMLPLTLYFIYVGAFYSYLLAFFTVVLSGVLLYAANNTFNYLVKSQYQAYHDYLTKLGNRRFFIELLENAIESQKKSENPIYLLLIDLDHFKTINDTLGHDVGDVLLCEVARRMHALSKEHHNTVARLGGDEFCVLSAPYECPKKCLEEGMAFAQKLLDVIKETYDFDGHHLYISASVGVSLLNNPKVQASIFIKEADIAMYEAKSQGRDGVMLFNDELAKRVERKLEIEKLLHFALEKNEMSLKYQPQMNHKDEVVGCEVLIRWDNGLLGPVGPDEFIPIAEQTGYIIELGYFVLEESFKTLKSWDEKGIDLKQMSINISMRQLFHQSFIQDVKTLCDRYLTDALCHKLVFEMTETSVAEDINKLIENMNILKARGIRFSMDDFGTGYSSLSYLRQIPLDELKIDKSFISELGSIEDNGNLIRTIVNMAKNLELIIVAEGVETEFQKSFLIDNTCDILQGFYFSRPIEKEAFQAFVLTK